MREPRLRQAQPDLLYWAAEALIMAIDESTGRCELSSALGRGDDFVEVRLAVTDRPRLLIIEE